MFNVIVERLTFVQS